MDDPFALQVEAARRRVGLEHRALRLLDLEEQRVAVVAPQHQRDPGARADAADADHFEGDVDQAVAVEHNLVLDVERVAVVGEDAEDDALDVHAGRFLLGQVSRPHDQRRVR